ncbi:hypothetical protein FK529_19385 [Tsukamurella asaccharolytica]|uniref:Lipoprotein n=1 Tax=Tsukamurella asaccharolytica TaxID=2592067 RepID=A0A5C5R4L8_9ACTN|nr:hypothetical protein [Tsukamurella asaccharolytica]TWS17672.1 hypothetical protein FK529_19385 [Tsukamurella asaccharolytica]
MGSSMKVAGALVLVAVAAAGCGDRSSSSAASTVTVTAEPSARPGTGSTGTQEPSSAAPSATPRVSVTALPTTLGRAVRVLTESGKTTCNIRAELVECQSIEFGKTYRAKTGEPAYGFVYRGGELDWYFGNMGVAEPPTTIRYGHTYSAFGWTVDASAEKTVFTRDGHGVSVDVANTTTF